MLGTRKKIISAGRSGKTLEIQESVSGYTIYEAQPQLMRSKTTECAMRFVGLALILAGYVHWFLPGLPLYAASLPMALMTMACTVGAGVSLYFFASRGFRRVVHIDMGARAVTLARINFRERSAICRKIGFDDLQSLFVKRAARGQSPAQLNIRVRGTGQGFSVLHGDRGELEALHSRICRDVRASIDVAPRRVRKVRPPNSTPMTPRPNHRKAAAMADRTVAAE